MASPVAIFDAACGVVTTEDNRVTDWRDARHGSGGESGSWTLINRSSPTAPTLVSEPNRRPHILFQGNHWFTLENHEVNGFKLDYHGKGSVLVVVVKNDRGYMGFHELFGGAGRGPNAQVRFESPTELMVYPVHNFFTINPSTDRFHSYVFRSYKGELDVYQDGVQVPSKSGRPAKSEEPPQSTFMAAVGCWFSKHALHGRISYISYHDSALKENESDWNNLLSTIGRVCDESNAGWTFEAVPTTMPPTANVGNGRFSTNPPPVAWGPAFLTNPTPLPANGSVGGSSHPVRVRRKAKPAWRAVFDGSVSLSLLSSLGGRTDSAGSRTPPDTCFLPTNPSLHMLNDGITYRLMQRKADALEEQYGDETLIKTVDAFCDVLAHYLAPSLATEEIKQWQALWMVASGQNENVLSGIRSGEELLRAYYFRCESPEQDWVGYCCPHEFVLLHRDSSGECFAHGECALFVSYRDACAHKRHAESAVPLYAVPLAYGSYGDSDLTWSSFLPDVEAVSGLLAQMQKLLKRTSRDTIFCSD
jgi:hypothetical protein